MNAYKIETTLREDGTLYLENLPFRSGELVEVIILQTSDSYLAAVSTTMAEWESEADELAYHRL